MPVVWNIILWNFQLPNESKIVRKLLLIRRKLAKLSRKNSFSKLTTINFCLITNSCERFSVETGTKCSSQMVAESTLKYM